MESVKAVIQAMTFWNWLALFAFLFATVSVLNAVLSLKSRYLDWRATKSKKRFPTRLKRLNQQLMQAASYHRNPNVFVLRVLNDIVFPLLLIVAAFTFMVFGLYNYFAHSSGFTSWFFVAPFLNHAAASLVALFISFMLFFGAFLLLVRLSTLVQNVYDPFSLSVEISDFIRNARRNNVIDESAEGLIEEILGNRVMEPQASGR